MNKFIVALDGLHYSETAVRYALDWTKPGGAFLSGIFLDDPTYTGFKIYDAIDDQGISDQVLESNRKIDANKRMQSAIDFSHRCQKAGLQHNIHHDRHIAVHDLIQETRFADLLLISQEETFSHHEQEFPSRFLREIMNDTECPIAILPKTYKPVENIIFFYDGRFQSVYSMRFFAFLFPNWASLPTQLMTVRSMEDNLHLPNNKLLKEWLIRHFKHVQYHVTKGIPEIEILNFLKDQPPNSIIVMGARRRIMLSKWLRTGILEKIIHQFDFPVFIAHP
jgi:nucleotide-binding universal stress UspA family protein